MSNLGFEEDFKNHMTFASFSAWQTTQTIKGMFAGENSNNLSFSKYLQAIGMSKKDPEPKNTQPSKLTLIKQKQDAIEEAQRIVRLHKKGREKTP